MSWTINEFQQDSELIAELAKRIGEVLVRSVNNRGKASIALSGGRTPADLYRHMATLDLPWQAITVSLVDERWVDESHPDSNAALIRNTLLQGPAAAARFVGMKADAETPASAEQNLDQTLRAAILPLNVVVLGMGEDGHTASLFPGAEGTAQALSATDPLLCRGISIADASYGRMSLTVPALLAAEHRFLYITGSAKRAVLGAALTPGGAAELPVRALLHAPQTHTEVYYAPQ